MTLSIHEVVTPAGHKAVRILASGEFTAEDATEYGRVLGPNGPFHHLPLLGVLDKDSRLTPEARRLLSQVPERPLAQAMVVQTAAQRVIMTFLVKIAGYKNTRAFSAETDALRWIDETIVTGAFTRAAGKTG